MKNNSTFIYNPPRKLTILIFTYTILFIVIISYVFSSKIYSKKSLKGVVNNSQIVIPIDIDNVKVLTNSSYLKIDNKKYNLNIENISDIYVSENINMQDVVIRFNNKKYFNNQIVEVTFYYEYDYIIKKIVRGVLK